MGLSGKFDKYDTLDKDTRKFIAQRLNDKFADIKEKVEQQYFDTRAEILNRSVVKVNNKILSLDPSQYQREVYNGRFSLDI